MRAKGELPCDPPVQCRSRIPLDAAGFSLMRRAGDLSGSFRKTCMLSLENRPEPPRSSLRCVGIVTGSVRYCCLCCWLDLRVEFPPARLCNLLFFLANSCHNYEHCYSDFDTDAFRRHTHRCAQCIRVGVVARCSTYDLYSLRHLASYM